VTTPQPDAVSAHQHHVRISETPGPEDSPKLCSQQGSGLRSGLLGGQRSGKMNSGVTWQIFYGGRCTMVVMAMAAAGTPLHK